MEANDFCLSLSDAFLIFDRLVCIFALPNCMVLCFEKKACSFWLL